MQITIDSRDVVKALRRLRSRFDDQFERAFTTIAQDVAQEAREVHPYTNRTGQLKRLTVASRAIGSFAADTLQSGVVAGTEYASYVEDKGFEFLWPAWQTIEPFAQGLLDIVAERAIEEAGLT